MSRGAQLGGGRTHLGHLAGQNTGKDVLHDMFGGKVSRATKKIYEIGMNEIYRISSNKNSGTSGVYQVRIHQNPVPTKVLSNHPLIIKCSTVNQNRSVQDKGAKKILLGEFHPLHPLAFNPQNASGSCCRSLVRTSRSSKDVRKLMGTCQFLRFLISTVLESQQSMKIKGRFHGAPKWWELATVSHWWFNLNMNMHDHSYYLVMKSMWKYICAWHSLEVLS